MHSEIAASYGLGSGAIVELAASPSVRSKENIGRNAKAPALPLNLSRAQLALPAQYGVHHALRADLRQVRLAQLTLHHQELHHLGWGCAWDLMVLFVVGANQIAHDKQQGIQRVRVVAAIASIQASNSASIQADARVPIFTGRGKSPRAIAPYKPESDLKLARALTSGLRRKRLGRW